MTHPIKTALIGAGRWGTNVARELHTQSDFVSFATKESSPTFFEAKHQTVEEILADTSISAVAITTPIATHGEMTRRALEAGKHVFCEKTLAGSSEEAYALAHLAKEKNLILMTGYIFLYHPVYQELKRILKEEKPLRIECVWKKHGTFTESIESNLLTHHLALGYDLFGMPQSGVITHRESGETACDRIEATLSYPDCKFVSRIDRLSEERSHTITASLANGDTLVWNGAELTRNDEPVFHSEEEPLTREIRAFLHAVHGGPTPVTAGDFGARILEIHELLR
ncbi:Gfo/Idh/MocA family oxidoreductase [bacterium]|nr:Gfo/Idh/MocA family oxidoreductase [bacterium]